MIKERRRGSSRKGIVIRMTEDLVWFVVLGDCRKEGDKLC